MRGALPSLLAHEVHCPWSPPWSRIRGSCGYSVDIARYLKIQSMPCARALCILEQKIRRPLEVWSASEIEVFRITYGRGP